LLESLSISSWGFLSLQETL